MGLIEDILVGIAALIEAELSSVRRSVMRLATGIMLLLASLVFVLAGVIALTYATYLLLSLALKNDIWGAFLTAASMLLLAGLIALWARRLTR